MTDGVHTVAKVGDSARLGSNHRRSTDPPAVPTAPNICRVGHYQRPRHRLVRWRTTRTRSAPVRAQVGGDMTSGTNIPENTDELSRGNGRRGSGQSIPRRSGLVRGLAVPAVLALVFTALVGCSSDSDDATKSSADGTDQATSTQSSVDDTAGDEQADATDERPLRILVSNDDGFDAPGIDAVVRALEEMPNTEVVVSAPATQQSGKGSTTTEGGVEASEGETISGHPAHVVAGTPADSVNWALDGGIDFEPDLVITGINAGQNLGLIADKISGTVGAARAASAHGIAALATSLGGESPETINDPVDIPAFDVAAGYVVEWVKEHRNALIAGDFGGEDPLLENLNVPLCSAGQVRGLARVELSASGENAIAAQNCESLVPQPTDDINAFVNGFATISSVPLVQVAA